MDAATRAFVTRVVRRAHRTVTSDHGNALGCAGAEKDDLHPSNQPDDYVAEKRNLIRTRGFAPPPSSYSKNDKPRRQNDLRLSESLS